MAGPRTARPPRKVSRRALVVPGTCRAPYRAIVRIIAASHPNGGGPLLVTLNPRALKVCQFDISLTPLRPRVRPRDPIREMVLHAEIPPRPGRPQVEPRVGGL